MSFGFKNSAKVLVDVEANKFMFFLLKILSFKYVGSNFKSLKYVR